MRLEDKIKKANILLAQVDWKEKTVTHTTPTGRKTKIKVKSLPPEEQAKYRPRKEKITDKVKKFLGSIKDLSSSVKQSIEQAPENIKKVIADKDERKKFLKGVATGIKKSPKKIALSVYESAKIEAKGFKTATLAIGKLAKREKLNKEDKKALYSVGIYAAGTALAAGGGAAIMGYAFGSSLSKHIAIKAVSKMADASFLHLEGVQSIQQMINMASNEEKRMVNLMVAHVAKVLEEGISDEEMKNILKG